MALAKSPLGRAIESGVLTFHQAMSGAVSPQYAGVVTGVGAGAGVGSGASSQLPVNELDKCRLGSSSALAAVAEHTAETAETAETAAAATSSGGANATSSTTAGSSDEVQSPVANSRALQQQYHSVNSNQQRERGVGESAASVAYGSSATIAVAVHMSERQRLRTSSMPAESRKVSMLRGVCP